MLSEIRDYLDKSVWYVGAFFMFHGVAALFHSVYVHFGGFTDYKTRLRNYGEWAVITGVTKGIGRCFAEKFAELGLNLILVGREPAERMTKLADELSSKYGIKCEVAVVDFNSPDLASLNSLRTALENKDVGILVNNAGAIAERPDYFQHISEAESSRLVNVNCRMTALITHLVANTCLIPKKKGLIVFLSSAAGAAPAPFFALYGATKAFLSYFALSIAGELKENGVDCTNLVPFFIATDMTAYNSLINRPSIISPSPETYVNSAIKTLGVTTQTTGYYWHNFNIWPARIISTRAMTFISGFVMKTLGGAGHRKND